MEIKKFLGPFSTNMRCLISKENFLLSCSDKIDEIEAGSADSSAKQLLIDNHELDAKGI